MSSSSSSIVLHEELVTEILSFLSVKSIMKLRCICKSWNFLLSNSFFIKTHLKKSEENNTHFLPFLNPLKDRIVVFPPIRRLLDDSDTTLRVSYIYHNRPYNQYSSIVGSCNGLLCLFRYNEYDLKSFISFWNPSTRTVSKEYGYFDPRMCTSTFSFGLDIFTDTYKVVGSRLGRSEVHIFSLGDNVWRKIERFPVIPIRVEYPNRSGGVYLNGTLNWLAIRGDDGVFTYDDQKDIIAVEQFVIVSLDLHTETYLQLRLPPGFNEVPSVQPMLTVLLGCLCFSYDFMGTYLVLWKMTELGDEKSWTQFLKISYLHLSIGDPSKYSMGCNFYPLCLSKDGDTLLLAFRILSFEGAIVYNIRDKSARKIEVGGRHISWVGAMDYVPSLVSFR